MNTLKALTLLPPTEAGARPRHLDHRRPVPRRTTRSAAHQRHWVSGALAFFAHPGAAPRRGR